MNATFCTYLLPYRCGDCFDRYVLCLVEDLELVMQLILDFSVLISKTGRFESVTICFCLIFLHFKNLFIDLIFVQDLALIDKFNILSSFVMALLILFMFIIYNLNIFILIIKLA